MNLEEELRLDNLVWAKLKIGCYDFSETVIRINFFEEEGICCNLFYPDSGEIEEEIISFKSIKPLKLNKWWKKNLKIENNGYPSYITSVHEYQNWFYWNSFINQYELNVG